MGTSTTKLFKSFWSGWFGAKWIEMLAQYVKLKTTGFTGNLDSSVNDVQLLANAVDALPLGEMNVPQVNTDWNATSGVAELLNKPIIPDAQIQADWLQANNAMADYIKNKPDLTETDPVFAAWLESWAYFASWIILDNSMFGSGNLTPQCVTVQDLANEVDALTLGGGGSAALVNVETISGNKTLVPADKLYQFLDCGITSRNIYINSAGYADGSQYIIVNNGAYNNNDKRLTIYIDNVAKNYLAVNTFAHLVHNGTSWYFVDFNKDDHNAAYGFSANGYGNGAAFGANAYGGYSGAALGYNTNAYLNGVAIGCEADGGGGGGVAVGKSANGATEGVAVGYYAHGHNKGVALGCAADTNAKNAAIALGHYAKCQRYNEFSVTADGLSTNKKTRGQVSWYGTTDGAVQTEIFLGGTASNRMTLLTTSCIAFKIDVTAVKSDGSQGAGYKIEGVIRRNNANNTVFVGTPVVTVLGEDDASWDVVVEADNTNEALVVKVTGAAATSITWHAAGHFTEVRI